MGLLRLINASRLAPLEELLADLRGGVPVTTNVGAGAPRRASPAPVPLAPRRDASVAAPVAFTPAPQRVAPTFAPPTPLRAEPKLQAEPPAVVPIAPASPRAMDTTPAQEASPAPSAPEVAQASGLTSEQVAEIKTAIQAQQKFLGELVEHSSRWELEGAELRIYFAPKNRPFAEMLEGRESLEKIRAASSKVLGRAVRVCAKLEAVAAAAASASQTGSGAQELRAQFERDPMVKSMLQRFGGKITEVKQRPGES
jgi:hypothetical protein